MNPYLEAFMHKNTPFRGERLDQIMGELMVNEYPKGTVLHEQGAVLNECFFILKGCIRQYQVDEDGKEYTIDFFTEVQAVVMFQSYKKQLPSPYSFVSLEDSIVFIGAYEIEDSMYDKYPELKVITRMMMESDFGDLQEKRATFMSSTPEERYLNLLENRNDLIQRAPQHQIASYLGITPESLSRLKKRLSRL